MVRLPFIKWLVSDFLGDQDTLLLSINVFGKALKQFGVL